MHWQAIMHWYKQSTAQLRIHVRRMQIKGFPILWRAHLQSSHIKGHLHLYFASLFWTIGNNAWLWIQKHNFRNHQLAMFVKQTLWEPTSPGNFNRKWPSLSYLRQLILKGGRNFQENLRFSSRRFRAPLILTLDSKHLKRIFSWLAGT